MTEFPMKPRRLVEDNLFFIVVCSDGYCGNMKSEHSPIL